jgi:hypothetical protein
MAERAAVVAVQRADAARRFPPLPEALVATLRLIAQKWEPQALVLTDVPDWVAWHLDRPAVLQPMWSDFPTVLATRRVAGLVLSSVARDRNSSDGDSTWVRIIDTCGPVTGFEGPTGLPGGSRLYVRAARSQEVRAEAP